MDQPPLDDVDTSVRMIVSAVRRYRESGRQWSTRALEDLVLAWSPGDIAAFLRVLEDHVGDHPRAPRLRAIRDRWSRET